jgi:hypothetical protein
VEIVLFAGYFALFLFIIRKYRFFRAAGLHPGLPGLVFTLKVLCGTAIAYLYTHIYNDRSTADIFKFFDDSGILFESLRNNPWHYLQLLSGIYVQPEELEPYLRKMKWWYTVLYSDSYNESRLIIRFNAFVRLFSLGYYPVHTLFMCFISLTGSTLLFRLFRKLIQEPAACFIISYLLPSYLFWTSAVLKEGIISAAMAMFLFFFFGAAGEGRRIAAFLSLSVSLLLIGSGKAYILITLIPCITAYFFSRKLTGIKALLVFLMVNALFLVVLFNLYRLSPRLDAVHVICFKRGEYIYLAERMNAGSLIFRNYLDFHWYSILAESPRAFLSVLLRPHLLEIKGVLYIFPAIENLLVLGGLAAVLYRLRSIKLTPVVLFFVNLVVVNFTLIGLTTPVLGSIIRYRSLFLPALGFILIQPYIPFLRKLFRNLGQD